MQVLRAIEIVVGIFCLTGLFAWLGMTLWWKAWDMWLHARMGLKWKREFLQYAFTKMREHTEAEEQKRRGK